MVIWGRANIRYEIFYLWQCHSLDLAASTFLFLFETLQILNKPRSRTYQQCVSCIRYAIRCTSSFVIIRLYLVEKSKTECGTNFSEWHLPAKGKCGEMHSLQNTITSAISTTEPLDRISVEPCDKFQPNEFDHAGSVIITAAYLMNWRRPLRVVHLHSSMSVHSIGWVQVNAHNIWCDIENNMLELLVLCETCVRRVDH